MWCAHLMGVEELIPSSTAARLTVSTTLKRIWVKRYILLMSCTLSWRDVVHPLVRGSVETTTILMEGLRMRKVVRVRTVWLLVMLELRRP